MKRRERPSEQYWDGREAQRHPNSYLHSEMTAEYIRDSLHSALDALDGLEGATLPLSTWENVAVAFEVLHEITDHLPHVELWCCVTRYNDKWSDNVTVWSAHLDEETAREWLPMWERRYANRADYDWSVELYPSRITNLMARDESPDRHNKRMGTR